ncbi:MAG: tripartite tricarboxylate transporter TctB family protein [Armatimonadetes bacterium]|nr:tripartite tricarboxylate transporter TctB family protein [Armatimonadota bacterium]
MGDRAAAAVAMATAVFYIREATSYRNAAVGDVVGPASYPILLGACLLALGAALLLKPGGAPAPDQGLAGPQAIRFGAALGAYVAVIEPVGFLISTFVFLATTILMLGERSFVRAGAVAAAATISLWALFERLLSVLLPKGLLGPWL